MGVAPVACDIWWTTAARAASAGELLDDVEWKRADRFRREADRTRFIAARGLAKWAVAEAACVEPRDVRIVALCRRCGSDEHGKPHAEHPRGTSALSVSHSRDIVMVATSDGPDLGVDVEHVDPDRWSPRLSCLIESCISPEGIGSAARFFTVWTCKEAILKCTGDGLLMPMSSLSIQLADTDGARDIRFVTGPWNPPRPLSLHTVPVPRPYAAAIAVASDRDLRLKVRAV